MGEEIWKSIPRWNSHKRPDGACSSFSPVHHTEQGKKRIGPASLQHKSLDLVLEGADLAHQVTGLVGGDAGGDDGAGDTAGTAESELAGDEDVDAVLVLGQKGDVHDDGERGGVGGEDDQFGGTAVEGLGGCCGGKGWVSWKVEEKDVGAIGKMLQDGRSWRCLPSLAPFLSWR